MTRKLLKIGDAKRPKSFPVVCVGASAGGLEALSDMLPGLDADFPGCILLVLHSSGNGKLPVVLKRRGSLDAQYARDGQLLRPGSILVGPADHHLLVNGNRVLLSRGPKQNNFRPAIDPLFRSAARSFGPQAVGVVLSGMLDDGSAGLLAIKRAGGTTIVQSPADAGFPDMPQNALAAVQADYVMPALEIGLELNNAVKAPRYRGVSMKKLVNPNRELERDVQGERDPNLLPDGKISTLTCPECGGTLWETRDGKVRRFLCHAGHGFSGDSLDDAQRNSVESALWIAFRALRERALLMDRFATSAARERRPHAEAHYRAELRDLKSRIDVLQKLLLGGASPSERSRRKAGAKG